jgi:hypothetical protein
MYEFLNIFRYVRSPLMYSAASTMLYSGSGTSIPCAGNRLQHVTRPELLHTHKHEG